MSSFFLLFFLVGPCHYIFIIICHVVFIILVSMVMVEMPKKVSKYLQTFWHRFIQKWKQYSSVEIFAGCLTVGPWGLIIHLIACFLVVPHSDSSPVWNDHLHILVDWWIASWSKHQNYARMPQQYFYCYSECLILWMKYTFFNITPFLYFLFRHFDMRCTINTGLYLLIWLPWKRSILWDS